MSTPTIHVFLVLGALLIVVPGWFAAWGMGMRARWAFVGAVPVFAGLNMLCILGADAVGLPPLHILTVAAPLLLTALLVAVRSALLLRARKTGAASARRSLASPWNAPWWALIGPVVGTLAGAWVYIDRFARALEGTPNGLLSVNQMWDVLWHASVLRWVADGNSLDPTGMGALQNIESQEALYYPTGWHGLGAYLMGVMDRVLDLSPVAATNLLGGVGPAIALPAALAGFTWLLLAPRRRYVGDAPRPGDDAVSAGEGAEVSADGAVNVHGARFDTARLLAASLAAGLAPVFSTAILPIVYVGTYVGAWPYLVAMCLVGSLIAMFAMAPYRPIVMLPTAVAFAGVTAIHPAVASYVVLGIAAWWLFYLLWIPATAGQPSAWRVSGVMRPVVARLRDMVLLGVPGLLALAVLVPQVMAGSAQSEEVNSFSDTKMVTRAQSWMNVLELQTRHANDMGVNWIFLWAAAIGAVLVLAWTRRLWIAAFAACCVIAAVHSMKNFDGWLGDAAAALGSLHYNTTHRMVMPVAMVEIIAAASAVAIPLAVLVALVPARARSLRIAAVSATTAAAVAVGGVSVARSDAVSAENYRWSYAHLYDPAHISQDEIVAYDWLRAQPHAYEGIIGNNPDEGSGWMYALYGLPALNRHYLFPRLPLEGLTNRLYWGVGDIGHGVRGNPDAANAFDAAARDMGMRFFVSSPPPIWPFQPEVESQTVDTWTAPGLTPVFQRGDTVIFAVNAEFSNEELRAMRASAENFDYPTQPLPPLPALPHRPTDWDEATIAKDAQRFINGMKKGLERDEDEETAAANAGAENIGAGN